MSGSAKLMGYDPKSNLKSGAQAVRKRKASIPFSLQVLAEAGHILGERNNDAFPQETKLAHVYAITYVMCGSWFKGTN